jgi:hypothetical protein
LKKRHALRHLVARRLQVLGMVLEPKTRRMRFNSAGFARRIVARKPTFANGLDCPVPEQIEAGGTGNLVSRHSDSARREQHRA